MYRPRLEAACLTLGIIVCAFPPVSGASETLVRHGQDAPISISECSAGYRSGTNVPVYDRGVKMHVVFTNTGNAPIREVRFKVVYLDQTFLVKDVGSFESGVETRFDAQRPAKGEPNMMLAAYRPVRCSVLDAKIAAGEPEAQTTPAAVASVVPLASLPSPSPAPDARGGDVAASDSPTVQPAATPSAVPTPPALGLRIEQQGRDVVVTRVISGGAAENAGVRSGDVLRAINEVTVVSIGQVLMQLHSLTGTDAITINVERNGAPQSLRVNFVPRAADL